MERQMRSWLFLERRTIQWRKNPLVGKNALSQVLCMFSILHDEQTAMKTSPRNNRNPAENTHSHLLPDYPAAPSHARQCILSYPTSPALLATPANTGAPSPSQILNHAAVAAPVAHSTAP